MAHGFLCPRCGSPHREIVGHGETRCSECGLGATSSSAISSVSAAAALTHDQIAERTRWLLAKRQRDFRELASASFFGHGLDSRWRGLRWLGGWGGSDGVVTHIQLAHGDIIGNPAATQIRIDTRPLSREESAELVWYQTAQHHVQELWRRTGKLSDDVRRVAFRLEPAIDDPTAPWAEVLLPVDEKPVAFRTLSEGDFWVAQARHGETVISIEAVAWPIESTGVITIRDLTEYESGSQAIESRWE
jgi:hypothetical protein